MDREFKLKVWWGSLNSVLSLIFESAFEFESEFEACILFEFDFGIDFCLEFELGG